MHITATRRGVLTSLLRRLKGRAGGRREFRKWQILLCGKSLEEQLWAVRPPKGGLSHPGVREWAQQDVGAGRVQSSCHALGMGNLLAAQRPVMAVGGGFQWLQDEIDIASLEEELR